jgi:hypothetical protein
MSLHDGSVIGRRSGRQQGKRAAHVESSRLALCGELEQIDAAGRDAALASEASGQRGDLIVPAPDTRPEPGSSARAALASEASGQRGHFMMRAGHSP